MVLGIELGSAVFKARTLPIPYLSGPYKLNFELLLVKDSGFPIEEIMTVIGNQSGGQCLLLCVT